MKKQRSNKKQKESITIKHIKLNFIAVEVLFLTMNDAVKMKLVSTNTQS